MICKWCLSVIAGGVRKCPHCGGWIRKPLFSAGGMAVVLILAFAAFLFLLLGGYLDGLLH